MSEGYVQLPPNSTGSQIRTESGDATNQIPTGVQQEVVIVADAQGIFPGDSRQAPIKVVMVSEERFFAMLTELRKHTWILSQALGVSIDDDELTSLDHQ